jgi:hypothetical protein
MYRAVTQIRAASTVAVQEPRRNVASDAAARAMGISVLSVSATTPAEIGKALAEMQRARVQGGIVSGDAVMRAGRQEIAHFAARSKLPVV